MVLRLMSCSPRRRIRLVTVIGGLRFCRTRSGRYNLRRLDTSNGCQDHTVLPYAAIVSRPRAVDRSQIFRFALRSHRAQNAAASNASHPASVTIAIRPSVGRDARSSRSDLGCLKTEIFLQRGLDTKLPDGQITTRPREPLSCPGRGAASSRGCVASSGHAAPQSRDPYWRGGPRISSASRRKRGALRSIRGTMERWQRFIRPS